MTLPADIDAKKATAAVGPRPGLDLELAGRIVGVFFVLWTIGRESVRSPNRDPTFSL